ncbi:MAG: hypothetical protein ACYTBV_10205 [Planctomycetota bacterium]|jgi:hypothetical protein
MSEDKQLIRSFKNGKASKTAAQNKPANHISEQHLVKQLWPVILMAIAK